MAQRKFTFSYITNKDEIDVTVYEDKDIFREYSFDAQTIDSVKDAVDDMLSYEVEDFELTEE